VERYLTLIVTTLAVAGCTSDVVTSRYETLSEARADHLFERGWLPDVLPPSVRNIRTTNNVDLNTSVGEFEISPSEIPLLESKVQVVGKLAGPLSDELEREIQAHMKSGGLAYQFSEETYTWVFLCNRTDGRCEYTMWPVRS
jgi:hypothetical protein